MGNSSQAGNSVECNTVKSAIDATGKSTEHGHDTNAQLALSNDFQAHMAPNHHLNWSDIENTYKQGAPELSPLCLSSDEGKGASIKGIEANQFGHVLEILDTAVGGPDARVGAHGAFWRGLSRDEFVAKRIFGEQLIKVGDGAGSNLVKALKGEAPFGSDLPNPPPGARYPRMPDELPPVPAKDIAYIQKWIDNGCPN